jgi:hypothetical protein
VGSEFKKGTSPGGAEDPTAQTPEGRNFRFGLLLHAEMEIIEDATTKIQNQAKLHHDPNRHH